MHVVISLKTEDVRIGMQFCDLLFEYDLVAQFVENYEPEFDFDKAKKY